MSKKGFIILSWILILLIGPITLFVKLNLTEVFSNSVQLINFFQRISGLTLFSLLFCQILLGSFMSSWTRYLGPKTFRYHIVQGLSTYGLLLAHPLLYVAFTYQTVGKLTTFILPNLEINTPIYELYLTYGRIALILLTIGVFAGYFRHKPFMRANWHKFHLLNYFSFFFVAIHAWNVGTDVKSPPFSIFYWVAISVITIVVFRRFLYSKIKSYFNVDSKEPMPQS